MINLTWDSRGRIGLAEYNKARWRHIAFCLIPVALIIGASVSLKAVPIWLNITGWIAGLLLLFYYRYRFLQVMVKRLHDRNLSGLVMLLSPVIMVVVLIVLGAGVIALADNGALPAWIETGSNWFWVFLLPVIAFNLFLRYQLSQAGTPGANKYGPPPNAAAMF